MEKCNMLPAERQTLEKLASETEDPLLSLAILLILRGATLPAPVIQTVLNGCSAMLDGYDVMKRKFTNGAKN